MKGLEKCIALASKVIIYVPATVHADKPVSNEKEVKATAELLAKLFGGATSSSAIGYWMSQTAGLIREKTTIVFAYCQQADLEAHIEEVVAYCETLKTAMSQESIALEVNGTMYFV